jgi:hypothetical protein
MLSGCPVCPIQNNTKSVSIITTNHIKAGTEATPTVPHILNVRISDNGRRICQPLSQILRESLLTVTDPQHNDNFILLYGCKLHLS